MDCLRINHFGWGGFGMTDGFCGGKPIFCWGGNPEMKGLFPWAIFVPGNVPGNVPGSVPGKVPGRVPGKVPGKVPGRFWPGNRGGCCPMFGGWDPTVGLSPGIGGLIPGRLDGGSWALFGNVPGKGGLLGRTPGRLGRLVEKVGGRVPGRFGGKFVRGGGYVPGSPIDNPPNPGAPIWETVGLLNIIPGCTWGMPCLSENMPKFIGLVDFIPPLPPWVGSFLFLIPGALLVWGLFFFFPLSSVCLT